MKRPSLRFTPYAFAALAVLATGCIGPNAKRLIPENKNLSAEGFSATVSTPWGTQTIKMDKLTTTVVTNYP